MKRIIVVIIINLMLHHNSIGQNLVPNPSFEDTVHCPNIPDQLNFSLHWYKPTGASSDYFNSCDISNYVGVPTNIGGYQFARTGNAYAGIYTYFAAGSNLRDYLQIKLDSTLVPSHKYCSEFYVSLADTQKLACNNIGMYFSDTAIHCSSGLPLNVIPQITNDIITNPLTDKIGWTKVSGSFIASGGEQFITIGNFIDDANSSHIILTTGNQGQAYYYIDDVSVIDCTNQGVEELTTTPKILISPNPATNSITITSSTNIKEIKLINLLGEMVSASTPAANQSTIDISNLSKGIYFVQIIDVNKNVVNRKIIVQ